MLNVSILTKTGLAEVEKRSPGQIAVDRMKQGSQFVKHHSSGNKVDAICIYMHAVCDMYKELIVMHAACDMCK